MNEFVLTIFGATGYTGRLCVAEAVRQGLPVRVAGRRAEAVEQLAAEYPGAAITTAVADVEDAAGLKSLVESSDVLLSTVGPYAQFGRPVVDAAIEFSTPYLDVTGELDFLNWVYAQSPRAEQARVSLAPAVGFDGVPGDLLASQAAAALDGEVATVRVAYFVEGGRASAGTARSALGALSRGGAVWRNGRVCQEPAGIEHWEAPFPAPPGPAAAISVPFPEVVTVGRSVGAQVVRCFAAVPGAWVLPPLAGPAQRVTSFLSTTPVWGLLERAVDRLPEGPSDESRSRAKTVVVAEAAGSDGVSVTRWARVSDPYGVTAVIAVAGARRLVDGGLPPGVLTPSQVFEPAALLAQIADEFGPV